MRAARERQGLSQKWLAEALNSRYEFQWYPSTVGKVESGERPARLAEAVALAQALGVLLEDLVFEYEDERRHEQGVHRAVAELEIARDVIQELVGRHFSRQISRLEMESLEADVDKAHERNAVEHGQARGEHRPEA